MEGLKWLAIAAVSFVGGYFWHKMTGSWAGAAVTVVGVALTLRMIFDGEWIKALAALCAGVYLVFTLMGEGPSRSTEPSVQNQVLPSTGGEKSDLINANVGVVAPAREEVATPKSSVSAVAKDGDSLIRDCPDCPQLVVVPAGQFMMGSDPKKISSPEAIDPREEPAHRVSVRSFAAGRYAVSRAEFATFVRATQYKTEAESGGCFGWSGEKWENHRGFHWREAGFVQADDHPAVCISWNDAQAYVQWLSQVTHQVYRLLSEAEREYATRAGSATTFWWGDTLSSDRANFDTTATDYRGSRKGTWRRATVPVSSFDANAFGLYNVHGNVWEWVQDCQHDTYVGAPADGSAWAGQCPLDKHVIRGGGWAGDPAGLRSATRGWFTADFRFNSSGFRVARNLANSK